MTSFAFIPRSVKKSKTPSAALSAPSEPSTSSSHRHEVSSTALVAQTSISARSRSGHNVSTDQSGGCEIQSSVIKSKGKSRQIDPSSQPSADSARLGEAIGTNTKLKATKAPDLEELAGLVCLALSDYQIWADTNLRRKLECGHAHDAMHENVVESSENVPVNDNRGYIPFDYLVHHSSVFQHVGTVYPETLLVKAIRAHATEFLDVRLVLASEEMSHGNKWNKNEASGVGYQVRRRKPPMEKSKSQWDNLTIYLENIPAYLRSLPGVVKLISHILPSSPTNSASGIQGVIFPRHHRDLPGSIPTCKGFALVVLDNSDDAEHILHSYPWEITQDGPSSLTTQTPVTSNNFDEASDTRRDARKFGLRTLLKPRWEALKAEYLSYRQRLVEEINQYQETEAPHMHLRQNFKDGVSQDQPSELISHTAHEEEFVAKPPSAVPQHDVAPAIHPNSPFPSGCLVFARNVNIETNKTTLRSLFSQSTKNVSDAGTSQLTGDGIDYVDYMKGMDNCHLRLSTPAHAAQLLTYLSEHPTTQMSGLDGVGKEFSADSSALSVPAISLELVLGKREQVYWEKVPEKVRRQAVDKALKIIHGPSTVSQMMDDDSGGRKKRQRKV